MKILISESQYKFIIEHSDKYTDFKNRWDLVSDYGDLEVYSPLGFKIYLFPNEKGFMVELYHTDNLIGQFHSYVDDDNGMMNDVEVDSQYQGMGLGKLLLLKSIEVSYLYLGYFQSDVRGLTSSQGHVYHSLVKSGVLDGNYNIDYNVAQKMIDGVINKLNKWYNKQQ